MNTEKRIFDFSIWLVAVAVLLAMLTGACNKRQAGAIGGRRTFEKHGRQHMATIGKAGAVATWTRYYLAPIGQTEYAMVERATNKIKTIRGR